VWYRVDICLVAYDALAGISGFLALWVGAFRWVVVRPLGLYVVRRTREQLDVVIPGLSLSVCRARLCGDRADCCRGRSSLIRVFYARRILCVFLYW
jgi:hypothetical protein